MEREESLDTDFDNAMCEIKNNINFLENEIDVIATSCWINRLNESTFVTPEEKSIRNEYVKYLSFMLKRGVIHHPFVDEPTSGTLPPLNISMSIGSLPGGHSAFPPGQRNSNEVSPPAEMGEQKLQAPPRTPSPCAADMARRKQEGLRSRPKMKDWDCLPPQSHSPPQTPPESKVPQSQQELLSSEMLDFISRVGAGSGDQGQLLRYTASGEIARFREFIQSVYLTRKEYIQQLLAKEQLKQKQKYKQWQKTLTRRSQIMLHNLKQLMPQFNYSLYKKDPNYLYCALIKQHEINKDLNPKVKLLRTKELKKKWLTEEAERIEKENEERQLELKDLSDQLNSLQRSYSISHSDLADKNKSMEEGISHLVSRFQQNQMMIESLMDSIKVNQ